MTTSANIAGDIFWLLSRDPLILPFVGKWEDEPAIFTNGPILESTTAPWIVSEGAADTGSQTIDALAGEVQTRNIFTYDTEDHSTGILELIAARIQQIFTWTNPAAGRFQNLQATASKPILDDQEPLSGRRIFLRFISSDIAALAMSFEDYEEPTENADGTITNFSTTRVYASGSISVFVNDVAQKPGTDFSEDGDRNGYTFTSGAPTSGARIYHTYRYTT